MKPILKVETIICGHLEDNSIWEPHGVTPFRWLFWEGDSRKQEFTTRFGTYEVEIKLTKHE